MLKIARIKRAPEWDPTVYVPPAPGQGASALSGVRGGAPGRRVRGPLLGLLGGGREGLDVGRDAGERLPGRPPGLASAGPVGCSAGFGGLLT